MVGVLKPFYSGYDANYKDFPLFEMAVDNVQETKHIS